VSKTKETETLQVESRKAELISLEQSCHVTFVVQASSAKGGQLMPTYAFAAVVLHTLQAMKGSELPEITARWLAADGSVLVLSYDLFIRAVKDQQAEAAAKAVKKGRGKKKDGVGSAQLEASAAPTEGVSPDAAGVGGQPEPPGREQSSEEQRRVSEVVLRAVFATWLTTIHSCWGVICEL